MFYKTLQQLDKEDVSKFINSINHTLLEEIDEIEEKIKSKAEEINLF